jgi:adenylyltransferase/sulfurtransferase
MIRYRLGCPDIAQRNAAGGKIPTTPISASIIGAMQVQEALKVIYKNEKQSMAGTHFKYEGMNNLILQYDNSSLKETCESHETIEQLIEARDLTAETTVGALLEWAENHFGDDAAVLHLGYEVVLEVTTRESEVAYPVLMAQPQLSDAVAHTFRKKPGEDVMITKSIEHGISKKNFPQLSTPLRQLGVPPLQILKIEANGAYHYVELTGDEHFLNFQ